MSTLFPPDPVPPLPALRQRSSAGILRALDTFTFLSSAGGSFILIALLVLLVGVIFQGALPAIRTFGWSFLSSIRWNPGTETFGALPFIYCTLLTSALALLLAVPVSIGCALFLVKLAPMARIALPAKLLRRSSPTGWVRIRLTPLVTLASFLIELLAAIPSIAYGLWGREVLAPQMHDHIMPFLAHTLGHLPLLGVLFSGPYNTFSILTASVVLAIMVTPIITAIVRDVLAVTPPELEQGALGLGATWWQAQKLVLGFAKMGIFGAIILGLARAMGETMAITMLIGNASPFSPSRGANFSLFAYGDTIASKLASQFPADTDAERHALLYLALILLAMTLTINTAARTLLLKSTTKKRT
jgi:phosphate transport system permease protein